MKLTKNQIEILQGFTEIFDCKFLKSYSDKECLAFVIKTDLFTFGLCLGSYITDCDDDYSDELELFLSECFHEACLETTDEGTIVYFPNLTC